MSDKNSKKALIIVDHGSAVEEANSVLAHVANEIAKRCEDFCAVEHCHMELAAPTIKQAFEKCVRRGASEVIVYPYFLVPGRHSKVDIPEMSAAAAAGFPRIKYKVLEPLGLHEKILEVILEKVMAENEK